MAVHIELEAVYVDGKRFVHARHVFPSELYKKAVQRMQQGRVKGEEAQGAAGRAEGEADH